MLPLKFTLVGLSALFVVATICTFPLSVECRSHRSPHSSIVSTPGPDESFSHIIDELISNSQFSQFLSTHPNEAQQLSNILLDASHNEEVQEQERQSLKSKDDIQTDFHINSAELDDIESGVAESPLENPEFCSAHTIAARAELSWAWKHFHGTVESLCDHNPKGPNLFKNDPGTPQVKKRKLASYCTLSPVFRLCVVCNVLGRKLDFDNSLDNCHDGELISERDWEVADKLRSTK